MPVPSGSRTIATADDPTVSIHTTTALPASGLDSDVVKDWLHAFAWQTLDYAILLVGFDRRVLWANPGAGWLLAATAGEIVGQPIDRFFTPDDRAFGVPGHEQRSALRQGSSDDDRWMLRADGERFWASGRTIALRRRDGEPLGFFKIFRDQTEVKMHIDVLQKQGVDESVDRDSVRAGFDARRKAAVDAAPSLGAELHMETLLLRDEVDAAVAFAREHCEVGDRQICVLFPEGAPIAIHADRHRIRQLFAILVGNAIRATDANGRIWINGTPEGEQVVVRVSDNGDGLGGRRLDNLFELFTAATLPVAEAESRVGMELVRTIVDLHGGTVQARSAGTDKGSEFTVRLPLPPAPGAALD